MAEHPLGVFALVNPMGERSLRVLTHRPDLLDILDLLDFVFGFFHYSKSGVEIEDRYPGGWSWLLLGSSRF
jgi:hypothetical protein